MMTVLTVEGMRQRVDPTPGKRDRTTENDPSIVHQSPQATTGWSDTEQDGPDGHHGGDAP